MFETFKYVVYGHTWEVVSQTEDVCVSDQCDIQYSYCDFVMTDRVARKPLWMMQH